MTIPKQNSREELIKELNQIKESARFFNKTYWAMQALALRCGLKYRRAYGGKAVSN